MAPSCVWQPLLQEEKPVGVASLRSTKQKERFFFYCYCVLKKKMIINFQLMLSFFDGKAMLRMPEFGLFSSFRVSRMFCFRKKYYFFILLNSYQSIMWAAACMAGSGNNILNITGMQIFLICVFSIVFPVMCFIHLTNIPLFCVISYCVVMHPQVYQPGLFLSFCYSILIST